MNKSEFLLFVDDARSSVDWKDITRKLNCSYSTTLNYINGLGPAQGELYGKLHALAIQQLKLSREKLTRSIEKAEAQLC